MDSADGSDGGVAHGGGHWPPLMGGFTFGAPFGGPIRPAFGYGMGAWHAGMPDTCRACAIPDRHGYQCPTEGKRHKTCVLCRQRFPDRECGVATECALCKKAFCDPYWGCRYAADQPPARLHPLQPRQASTRLFTLHRAFFSGQVLFVFLPLTKR